MTSNEPPVMPYEFWASARFRNAFETRDMGKVIRLFRTAEVHRDRFGPDGITQIQLGMWLGLHQTQVSDIERGKKPVDSISKMIEWAEILSIPNELLWFDLTNSSRFPPVSTTSDIGLSDTVEAPSNNNEEDHIGTRPTPSLRTLLEQKIRERRLSFAEFAEVAEEFARKNKNVGTLSVRHLQRLIAGKGPNGTPLGPVRPATARLLEEMFGISIERLLGPPESDHESAMPVASAAIPTTHPVYDSPADDEIAAIELSRRFSYSGVGGSTLDQLEAAFDSLAMDYPVTPPAVLLPRIRGHLRYVTQLMEGRKTLSERIRLTTTAGWLSLLAGTVNIDLKRHNVAVANLQAASSLAKDVDNSEIRAWCYETAAWQSLTDGDYQNALELSRAAQNLAPEGSSISIQSAAQEGRSLARLGKTAETYEVLNRVHRQVSTLPRPGHPEHHYRYDPDKSTAYTATTLAWVGDRAAESYAREVIDRLSPSEDLGKWPRRVATAKLDLSLALIASDKLDEASATAQQAILSGRIVPSNRWRAAEIVKKIEMQRIPEAAELRDAFNTACSPPRE